MDREKERSTRRCMVHTTCLKHTSGGTVRFHGVVVHISLVFWLTKPRPPWAETGRSREGRAGSIYYSRLCPNDGTGILTRLKIVVLWVRIPLWAPFKI